jgi:uncharacterized membrane protein
MLTFALLKLAHLLAVVLWVGGMFFAHVCLRPAAATLDPPQRLALMAGTLSRFLALVLWAAPIAWVSGVAMLHISGRMSNPPLGWTLMAALGTLMLLIYGHIRFAQFPAFQRAVQAADWPRAGAALGRIRHWVLINLILGVATIASTALH